jgi:GDPmannose 4,6-dehydratase
MEKIKPMKTAFITGISGQDGSLLAEFLLKKDYIVYGLMRESSNDINLKNINSHPNFNIIYGNLLNNELIAFLLKNYKFNEIYNLASQSNTRLSYAQPLITFNVTLIGTLIILDNIKKYSPFSKLFQSSSSSMFGNSCDKDGFQRENTIFNPINPYASAKLFAHNISSNYRVNENLYISNGILFNHESTKSKNLLGIASTLSKKVWDIKNNKINNFYIPDLDVKIDLGYAPDYVKAMWLTLQQDQSSDYIISSGSTFSIRYMCDYLFKKLNLNYQDYIKTDITSPQHKFESKGDNSKLQKLGWKLEYDLDFLLDELFKYYQN